MHKLEGRTQQRSIGEAPRGPEGYRGGAGSAPEPGSPAPRRRWFPAMAPAGAGSPRRPARSFPFRSSRRSASPRARPAPSGPALNFAAGGQAPPASRALSFIPFPGLAGRERGPQPGDRGLAPPDPPAGHPARQAARPPPHRHSPPAALGSHFAPIKLTAKLAPVAAPVAAAVALSGGRRGCTSWPQRAPEQRGSGRPGGSGGAQVRMAGRPGGPDRRSHPPRRRAPSPPARRRRRSLRPRPRPPAPALVSAAGNSPRLSRPRWRRHAARGSRVRAPRRPALGGGSEQRGRPDGAPRGREGLALGPRWVRPAPICTENESGMNASC